MYVCISMCKYIFIIYIYIHIPFNILCKGVTGLIPYEDELKLRSRSISLYIYICVCVLCEYIHIIYIYIKGGDGLYPLWSQVEATIPFNNVQYLLFRGGGGIWSLRKASGGRRSGFFPAEPPWRLSCWRHFPEQPSRGYPASAPSWRSNISVAI